MAKGEVRIDAEDWGQLKAALASLPKIEKRLETIETQLNKAVHEACTEHEACAKAAFGARKFQYTLVGAIIVLNAVVVPIIVAMMLK